MVLDGVTPIILVVVLGFFSAKLQMLSLNSAKELNRMVFFLCATNVLYQSDHKCKFRKVQFHPARLLCLFTGRDRNNRKPRGASLLEITTENIGFNRPCNNLVKSRAFCPANRTEPLCRVYYRPNQCDHYC